ncbi:MAG TPA: EexN family lipoprotein [Nitrosospira sp.]|nr:EexN family lipoprotein [Nitrosospira sp.]
MNDKNVFISAVASLLVVGLVGGCGRSQAPHEVRPVEWYEANPAERAAKLEECKSSTQKLDATPDCINASRAENNTKATTKWGEGRGEVRTVPTIP